MGGEGVVGWGDGMRVEKVIVGRKGAKALRWTSKTSCRFVCIDTNKDKRRRGAKQIKQGIRWRSDT